MTESMELNMEALNDVNGGYKKPAEKAGCIIYQIKRGDTLGRIAKTYKTTVQELMLLNPKIKNRNLIYAGDYLYIKQ